MTDASNKTGGQASGAKPPATTASTRSTASGGAITPALALARHVEWLDFALAAARSEETWRAARLKKATKKTLDKRTSRLAEVRDEIAELAALIQAIRGLKSSAPSRSTATAAKSGATRRAKPPATAARKRATAPKPQASTSTAAASAASTATRATTARKTASTTPRKTATTRKRSTTATAAGSTRAKPAAATTRTAAAPTTRRRAPRPAGPPAEGPA